MVGIENNVIISPKQKQKKIDPAVAKDLAKIQSKMNFVNTTPERKFITD